MCSANQLGDDLSAATLVSLQYIYIGQDSVDPGLGIGVLTDHAQTMLQRVFHFQ